MEEKIDCIFIIQYSDNIGFDVNPDYKPDLEVTLGMEYLKNISNVERVAKELLNDLDIITLLFFDNKKGKLFLYRGDKTPEMMELDDRFKLFVDVISVSLGIEVVDINSFVDLRLIYDGHILIQTNKISN